MDEPRAVLKKADELLRRDDASGAAELYKTVAQFYESQGLVLKAIAVWKQIRAITGPLDREREEARSQLVVLYRSVGLTADADQLEAETSTRH